MPYILSPNIRPHSPGMWNEGSAYEKQNIYNVSGIPPVNYDSHVLRPHSLTHCETPAHTQEGGKSIDHFFEGNPGRFFGPVVVIKLQGNNYRKLEEGKFHWAITKDELTSKLEVYSRPAKIFISTEFYPLNADGYHDPDYILTLSQEAADYLCSMEGFHLYGTSWKSSDYNPGKRERPIHNTLFQKGLVMENLKLDHVPEGKYLLMAFPLPLAGASESPVVPALFTEAELSALGMSLKSL